MAKPIACFYAPSSWYVALSPSQLMSMFNGYDDKRKVGAAYEEYLWWFFIDDESGCRIEVHNANNIPESTIEELTAKVIQAAAESQQ